MGITALGSPASSNIVFSPPEDPGLIDNLTQQAKATYEEWTSGLQVNSQKLAKIIELVDLGTQRPDTPQTRMEFAVAVSAFLDGKAAKTDAAIKRLQNQYPEFRAGLETELAKYGKKPEDTWHVMEGGGASRLVELAVVFVLATILYSLVVDSLSERPRH